MGVCMYASWAKGRRGTLERNERICEEAGKEKMKTENSKIVFFFFFISQDLPRARRAAADGMCHAFGSSG